MKNDLQSRKRETSIDEAAEIAMAAAAGVVPKALRAGARAPGFTLPDRIGTPVSLDERLRAGPVVLNFHRGAWCAFSEKGLAEFEASYRTIAAAGASVLTIAPPGKPSATRGPLPMPELVDTDMKVARAFGLVFELPIELRDRYLSLGYVPPRTRKAGSFLVPIPATYLIGRDGVVVLAYVDVDYRNGPGCELPASALHALRERTEAQR
ncbi:MAG TPA: peroxiredoxin-like family protein [Paraburkholderia sp.]|nr:peroxiredoxin-like family protein [Paraburkholderia sp.]